MHNHWHCLAYFFFSFFAPEASKPWGLLSVSLASQTSHLEVLLLIKFVLIGKILFFISPLVLIALAEVFDETILNKFSFLEIVTSKKVVQVSLLSF